MGKTTSGGRGNPAALPLRPCVGVVLANARGEVFLAERIDTPGAWQMPQGGIDPGEDAQTAALRELEEEIGVPPRLVAVEAEHPDWLDYELPDHLIGKVWKGRWRGQTQRWFLVRFHGTDEDITLDVPHPEFSAWRWGSADEAIDAIVPFKRDIYETVLSHFRRFLGSSS
ncbi:MAG: RNA pyrophosphohydrolase [Pseudomonadota bacterium]